MYRGVISGLDRGSYRVEGFGFWVWGYIGRMDKKMETTSIFKDITRRRPETETMVTAPKFKPATFGIYFRNPKRGFPRRWTFLGNPAPHIPKPFTFQYAPIYWNPTFCDPHPPPRPPSKMLQSCSLFTHYAWFRGYLIAQHTLDTKSV